ncbi:DUF1801 domain-containing protein [bacterium]|nr:DUF1801 domain-containing protein [bacterium]
MAKTHPHVDMPSEADLGVLLEGRPPEIRQLYLDAHRLVLEAVPDIRYSVDCVDGEIGYGARQFGYDGWGMAAVTPYTKWVSVTFLRGARLADPDALLEGATLMRHVKLKSTEQFGACRQAIKRLLDAAAKLNES